MENQLRFSNEKREGLNKQSTHLKCEIRNWYSLLLHQDIVAILYIICPMQ